MSVTFKKTGIILLVLLAALSYRGNAQSLSEALRYTDSENFDAARAVFEQLITKEPNNGTYYFYYGENYLKTYFSDTVYTPEREMTMEAEKLFKKGTEADPANPRCFVGLGKIALMLGDLTLAEKFFNEAQSKFPGKTNKTSTLSEEDQAITLAKIAEAYLLIEKKKGAVKALPLLAAAVEKDPRRAEIYLIYGDAYLEANDGSSAIAQYKMAQELAPQSPFAKLRLGQLWVRARNWTEAISYYREAIDIDPNFAPAYLELAKIYDKANQNDNAIANYKKYVELSKNNVTARIKYVGALIDAKKYKDALSELTEIKKIDSTRNDLNRAMAYCYYEINDYKNALLYINKFFSRATPEKTLPSDYFYRGKILSRTNADSLAIFDFEKALELDAENFEILTEMAESYKDLKKYEKAVEFHKLKISKKGGTADYYRLGLVYYNMQAWHQADTAFMYITINKPDYMKGKAFYWRGLCNANIDTAAVTWQAKPFFESYIEMVKADSVKYAKDLVVCYDYIASYYLIGQKDPCNAEIYYTKIIALDPKNERILDLLGEAAKQCKDKK